MDTDSTKTSFGFRQVDATEKEGLVRGVFSSVAQSYDLMNDFMSLGTHRLWKREFVNMINPTTGRKYLDVAGGTGDIAHLICNKLGSSQNVTITDINQEMLNAGRNKRIDSNYKYSPEMVCGNAESLPFKDNYFDNYSIAFGIRNVTNIQNALNESYRVLAPTGRFTCLEFSPSVNPYLGGIYDFYSFKIIPQIGKLVADDEASYLYLAESIRRFPKPDDFSLMIAKAGFSRVTHRSLSGGIVRIHSGWKFSS